MSIRRPLAIAVSFALGACSLSVVGVESDREPVSMGEGGALDGALPDGPLSEAGGNAPSSESGVEPGSDSGVADGPPVSVIRAFTEDTFIEQMCAVHDYDLDLHIPTKAVLGQAYLIAKINFLKALGYNLTACSAPAELRARLDREVGQSIYTKLAEELFVSIVTDASAPPGVKTGAARFLFRVWEERLLIEVDDFAPLLEAAWEARSKVLPVLGTMLGTHEVFRLFQEARDHRFLDYFEEEDIEEEQLFAFEEFLFGLSHEDIARLRAHLASEGRACVSLDEARALLGIDPSGAPALNGAQALYTSYKKRRVNAAHRALTGAPGPKKTAEEYVMIAYLHDGASPSTFGVKAAETARAVET